jgi:hypothetical protein
MKLCRFLGIVLGGYEYLFVCFGLGVGVEAIYLDVSRCHALQDCGFNIGKFDNDVGLCFEVLCFACHLVLRGCLVWFKIHNITHNAIAIETIFRPRNPQECG